MIKYKGGNSLVFIKDIWRMGSARFQTLFLECQHPFLTCDCSIQRAEMKNSHRVICVTKQTNFTVRNNNSVKFILQKHLGWGWGGHPLMWSTILLLTRSHGFQQLFTFSKRKKIKEENISQVKKWYWSSKT